MICPNCQYVAPDNHTFCSQCGRTLESLGANPVGQPVPVVAGNPYPPFYGPQVIPYPPDFPARLLRNLLRSPLFVVGAILLFISILGNLANLLLIAIVQPTTALDGVAESLAGTGLSALFAACCQFVPAIFLFVALVRLLRAANRPDRYLSGALGTLGMTVIAAVSAFAASSAVSIVLEYDLLSPDNNVFTNGTTESTMLWMQTIMFALIILTLLCVVYYFIHRCVRDIRHSVDTGQPNAKPATLLATMLLIQSAVLLLILCANGLVFFFIEFMQPETPFLNLVETICFFLTGVACLLIGIVLCRYSHCTKNGRLS